MEQDRAGLVLTVTAEAGSDAFNHTVDGYLAFAQDTGLRLKQLLEVDPNMPMAHVLRGYFFNLMAVPGLIQRAKKEADVAASLATTATQREQLHIQALRHWSHGDLEPATACWEEILLEAPRDILATKLAHFTHFYLGRPEALRDSILRVAPVWEKSEYAYGYVQSMCAFGLEEAGHYDAAEAAGREAVALNPADAWGVHAVAHVMEMQDRREEGIAWIKQHQHGWNQCNNFRFHLWWHRALMHLDRGEADAVLALYDEEIMDPASDEYLDLCNDASLLLRLEFAGVDVGERWQALRDKVESRTQEQVLTFANCHYMMALTATGAEAAVAEMRHTMATAAAADVGTFAEVASTVGLAITDALVHYRQGHYAEATVALLPVRYDIRRIGGSRAQRDVFQQLLIVSAIASENWPLARGLLAERSALQPQNAWTRKQHAVVQARLAAGRPH